MTVIYPSGTHSLARAARKRVIECTEHEASEWQGDVTCALCGWNYQTNDCQQPNFAPDFCDGCGTRLMPASLLGPIVEFSARAICHDCYVTKGAPVTYVYSNLFFLALFLVACVGVRWSLRELFGAKP